MAERLLLAPRHRAAIEALLKEHLPDVEVWAYGSRVNGRAHDGSDLDLVLRASGLREIPDDRFADFKDALRDSNIPFLVEARDWARLPETFHREIERNYVVLVGKLRDRDQTDTRRRHEWPTATIEEIAEKVAMGPFGSSIKVETFVPEGIPIISGQHLHGTRVDDAPGFNFITEEHAKKLANANVYRGDIIFTHAGNIGQAAYIPEHSIFSRYVVSQRQFYLRCNRSKILPEFVALYFKSPDGQHRLLANSSQVGVPSIAQPVTYLRTVEIPLPPLPEQRAIAHILGTLDDKIELNRRMNETLEAMARAIFRDWFVDFGPTRAKAEGRKPYLASEIWDLFPDALDDEGKPAGWEIRPASDLFRFNPRESVRKGTMTPYLDMAALPTVGLVPDAPVQREYKSGSKFKDGDTLFARITPCLENGKTAYVFDLGDEVVGTGSTEFIVIRSCAPRPKAASYLLARDPGFRACAEQSMAGTSGRQRADSEALSRYEVASPSDDRLWTALGNLIGPVMDRIIANAHESRSLTRTRDLLLPKLVSGEIRLHEAVRG